MNKPKVYVTRLIPHAGLERIREVSDAEIWEGEEPPPFEVLLEKVKGKAGLVSLLTDRINRDLIDAAANSLKVISQMAVGFDNIDMSAATQRGIPVGHTPEVLNDATTDFAFALLMSAARRIVEGALYVKAGLWKTWGPTLLMGQNIYGMTLGIVGFGRIGRGLAKRAVGFGMRVLYTDPRADEAASRLGAERRDLDELLAESDFVSLHVRLNEETTYLIGARELGLMKPTAVLVNTSRGAVVNPVDLYRALKNGDIAYAALDVTEPEPISADDPLLTLENCIIVPHIASSTLSTRSRMAIMVAENLEAGLPR